MKHVRNQMSVGSRRWIWTMMVVLSTMFSIESLAGTRAAKAVYIDWDAVQETGPAAELEAEKEDTEAAEADAGDEDELTLADGRTITPLGSFLLTGYCSCYSCSEGYGTLTSTGTHAHASRTIAVDPRVIPYGSHVLINGQEYIAEDRGGAVKNNHIDIYFNSHGEASNVREYAEVYLITGGSV